MEKIGKLCPTSAISDKKRLLIGAEHSHLFYNIFFFNLT